MGAFLAVYYWNTGNDVLPTRNQNGVQTTVPQAIRLDELVIVDLVEEQTQPCRDDFYNGNILS